MPFQVDFCKIPQPEATGKDAAKEYVPGAAGPLLRRQGSSQPNTMSALLTAKGQANSIVFSRTVKSSLSRGTHGSREKTITIYL